MSNEKTSPKEKRRMAVYCVPVSVEGLGKPFVFPSRYALYVGEEPSYESIFSSSVSTLFNRLRELGFDLRSVRVGPPATGPRFYRDAPDGKHILA